MAQRTFSDSIGVRKAVPLIVGLVGASSSGKSKSALRLATGMQTIAGGDIWAIDTEADRMLHYAPTAGAKASPPETFNFRHIAFRAPFDPLSYLAAVEHCAKNGAKQIIIDSASHLHEGPGGTLETHAEEQTRLAKLWGTSEDKAKMSAWQKPKSELRRFLNTVLQMRINLIFCYRAKIKTEIATGEKPKSLGYMPIAGEEMTFEALVNILLYPNSGGIPTWRTDEKGEREIIKLPQYLQYIFPDSRPLDERHGAELAKWAAGDSVAQAALPKTETEAMDRVAVANETAITDAINSLGWKRSQIVAWLLDLFGVDAFSKLTMAQTTDAVALLTDKQVGADAYDQRMGELRRAGRIRF